MLDTRLSRARDFVLVERVEAGYFLTARQAMHVQEWVVRDAASQRDTQATYLDTLASRILCA